MKTATDYAREKNAATREWLAANPGGWAPLMVEDAAFWAKQGIHTYDDLDRCMAIESYSDAYKEIVGIRPYINPNATTADLWAAYNALCLREVETPETFVSFMDRTATVAADGSRSWTL